MWNGLAITNRYVTGDQWGPLVKLFTQDYEVHLHMDALGTHVSVVGTVKNRGTNIRLNGNHYVADVQQAGGVPLASRPLPPTLAVAQAVFLASQGAPTTYHQWLRTETTGAAWTLGCGRGQQARMRGHKPPYQA